MELWTLKQAVHLFDCYRMKLKRGDLEGRDIVWIRVYIKNTLYGCFTPFSIAIFLLMQFYTIAIFGKEPKHSPKKNNDKKNCYKRGLPFKPNHVKECETINLKWLNCSKVGLFARSATNKKP